MAKKEFDKAVDDSAFNFEEALFEFAGESSARMALANKILAQIQAIRKLKKQNLALKKEVKQLKVELRELEDSLADSNSARDDFAQKLGTYQLSRDCR